VYDGVPVSEIRQQATASARRRYNSFTRAEDKASPGRDLSAAASADWRGGNAVPLRASLPESDKSWGRRGKAPEKVSNPCVSCAQQVQVVWYALAADRSDRRDGGVARKSGHISPQLHRHMVSSNCVRTRPATAFGRPGTREGDVGCSDPASAADARTDPGLQVDGCVELLDVSAL
jgi:hypothetical protein